MRWLWSSVVDRDGDSSQHRGQGWLLQCLIGHPEAVPRVW